MEEKNVRKRFLITLTLLMSLSFILVACGGSNGNNANEGNNNVGNEKQSNDFRVAMVPKTGGEEDKSLNRSAGEACKLGEKNMDLKKVLTAMTMHNQKMIVTICLTFHDL